MLKHPGLVLLPVSLASALLAACVPPANSPAHCTACNGGAQVDPSSERVGAGPATVPSLETQQALTDPRVIQVVLDTPTQKEKLKTAREAMVDTGGWIEVAKSSMTELLALKPKPNTETQIKKAQALLDEAAAKVAAAARELEKIEKVTETPAAPAAAPKPPASSPPATPPPPASGAPAAGANKCNNPADPHHGC